MVSRLSRIPQFYPHLEIFSLLDGHDTQHGLAFLGRRYWLVSHHLDVEALQEHSDEHDNSALGYVTSRTQGVPSAKGPPVVTTGRVPLLHESLVLEILDGVAEYALVEMKLAVGNHQSIPLAKDLASDDGVFRDELDGCRVR